MNKIGTLALKTALKEIRENIKIREEAIRVKNKTGKIDDLQVGKIAGLREAESIIEDILKR